MYFFFNVCLQRVINALNNIRTIKIKHVGVVSVWCALLMERLLKLKSCSVEFKARNMFWSANKSSVGSNLPRHSKPQGATTYQTSMSSGRKSSKLFECSMKIFVKPV